MKRITLLTIVIFLFSAGASAQESSIVKTIDSLTLIWDKEALILETYDGMKEYCTNGQHRRNTINLVRVIHHYDSVLYKTVTQKYDESQDAEAYATLKDIEKLEKDYTTKNFLDFIHTECSVFNEIEKNYGRSKGKKYEKEVEKMEKELVKYVEAITGQIDVIDEHVHHLESL